MAVFQGIGEVLLAAYESLISAVPITVQLFIKFFVLALLIVLYALFVWKFYQSIGKKNLIELNLSKYNKSKHPFFEKLLAGALFLLEYIIIIPIAIFLWFASFTIFLILLTENVSINLVLILSATTIAAIRMISYHNEDLAKEVAKLVPFVLLATSLPTPGFFSVERILGQIKNIPSGFGSILIYLMFIIFLEVVLRALDFIISIFEFGEEE